MDQRQAPLPQDLAHQPSGRGRQLPIGIGPELAAGDASSADAVVEDDRVPARVPPPRGPLQGLAYGRELAR
eukprot:12485999-Alexandrium_andersonii.AAC.1